MRNRRALLLTAILLLGLAACGQPPAPTGGDRPALLAAPTEGPTATPVPTPTPLGTEDPSENVIFDELTVIRSGGILGQEHTVTVLGDGALIIDGAAVGSVGENVLFAFNDQIKAMGFFRLESHYGPIAPGADTFAYEIRVQRDGASQSVTTVDGHIPASLQRLIGDLFALQPTGPAPAATPVEAPTAEHPPTAEIPLEQLTAQPVN